MKKQLSILLTISCLFSAMAQKKRLTLSDCLKIGLQNNLELKAEKLTILKAKKQRFSYGNSLLPNVGIYGSHHYNFGSTIDPKTNSRVSQSFLQDNLSLQASSNILNIENIYNAKSSKLNLKKQEANLKLIEQNYTLEVIALFFNTLFTQELLEIQKKQFKNTVKNLKRIKNEVNIGNKPKSDLYDITLSYTQEEKKVLETEQKLQTDIQALLNLINDTQTNFKNLELVKNSLKSTEYQNNPELTLANINKKISDVSFSVQKSSLLPKFSLFYNLSSFYYKPTSNFSGKVDNFNTQLTNNKNQQVGLRLSLTVFDGFRRNKKISEAKIEKERQDLLLQNVKNKITQKVNLEKLKEQQLINLQEQLASVYKSAKKSFTTAQAKFENGQTELQVFNITKNQLLNAEYDVLKNQLELDWVRERLEILLSI